MNKYHKNNKYLIINESKSYNVITLDKSVNDLFKHFNYDIHKLFTFEDTKNFKKLKQLTDKNLSKQGIKFGDLLVHKVIEVHNRGGTGRISIYVKTLTGICVVLS